jgi:hypothetical protein
MNPSVFLRALAPAALVFLAGCAHKPLSGSDLDRVSRPAFISRIEGDAGPRSTVFRDDSSYRDRLGRLDSKEADRRLAEHLAHGSEDKEGGRLQTINRFQVGDTLRATTLALLPKERPWTNAARPGDVAAALQSFLVEEVPANKPDYELLRPLGVDSIIEFVVEEYGMRSEGGRAGVYVVGYARMFMLDGGGNIWFRSFRADAVESHQPPLDPFKVNKDTSIFRAEMTALLKVVADVFARDLNPPGRRGGAPLEEGHQEIQEGSDSSAPAKVQKRADDPL